MWNYKKIKNKVNKIISNKLNVNLLEKFLNENFLVTNIMQLKRN